MTRPLGDMKATVELIPQANGSVAVKIQARERVHVQDEIDVIVGKIDKTNGKADFWGPFRVPFGYAAIGNYHVFNARHFRES